MSTRAQSIVAIVAILIVPTRALAQFGARAEIEPPIAAGSDVDPTGSATTVEMDDRPRALETTDEVLLEVPGARRRRTGGFGGFTALSIRGAEAEQTTVLLGDVPLTTADGSAFDLSTVPPWIFDRIEVHRGGAPVWLGAGAIGGVLRLIPRTGRGTRAEIVGGAGSWDLAQGRIGASVEGRDVSFFAIAGLTSSSGAYPMILPRLHMPEVVQANAQLLEAVGLVHAQLRAGAGTMSIVGLGLERTGGVPPPGTRWTPDSIARRAHTRAVVAIAGEWLEGGRAPAQADLAAWRAQIVASIGFDRRHASDPQASFGQVRRATDERLTRFSLRGATTFRIAEWLSASIVGVGWHEAFDPEDPLASRPPEASRRDGGALAVEARFHGREGDVRWELRPSARVELIDSQLVEIRAGMMGETTSSFYALPTARLGAVVEVVPGIAIQASGATAGRSPSTIELFGDGGFLLGSTSLRPERSHTVDGGVVARGTAGPISGTAEVRGFGLWIEDLIRYRSIAQNQVIPENVVAAWVAGIEGSARATFERWGSLTGAITWIETREEAVRARQLTFRPRLTAYVRPGIHLQDLGPLDRATVYADLEYVSEVFADPDNTDVLPEIVRVGVGVSVETLERHVRIDLIVRDIFDARGVDYSARPLPGRSVALQIGVHTD